MSYGFFFNKHSLLWSVLKMSVLTYTVMKYFIAFREFLECFQCLILSSKSFYVRFHSYIIYIMYRHLNARVLE